MLEHPGWPEPWPPVTVARPKPNSTLLRMAFVAAGKWDATLVLGQKADWDLAAGTILIEEAGGVATTHRGEKLIFNRAVPAQRAPKMVPPATTEPAKMGDTTRETKQLLHIVFGGELKDVTEVEFEDLSKVDFVGAFPNYKEAYDAWKNAAQRTVDNAETRYFILHAHKLLDPETGDHHHV